MNKLRKKNQILHNKKDAFWPRLKDMLLFFRNVTCIMFTWLSIIVISCSMLLGAEFLPVKALGKLFLFCLLTGGLFTLTFSEYTLGQKSFLFRLTIFSLVFLPLEITFFYWVGLFSGPGSFMRWGFFVLLVLFFYIACVIIDRTVYAKKATEYTQKLKAYQNK